MDNNVYLKDIRHENEHVYKWEYISVTEHNVRIYYKLQEPESIFEFFAIEGVGCVINEETKKNEWHKDYCFVECVCTGIAFHDGIRHMYFGDESTENKGYCFYPDFKLIANTMIALKWLESKLLNLKNNES